MKLLGCVAFINGILHQNDTKYISRPRARLRKRSCNYLAAVFLYQVTSATGGQSRNHVSGAPAGHYNIGAGVCGGRGGSRHSAAWFRRASSNFLSPPLRPSMTMVDTKVVNAVVGTAYKRISMCGDV